MDGLAAGITSFEHLSFMTADGVDPIPDAVLAELVRRSITVGMTLGLKPVPGMAPPPGMITRLPALIANGQRLYESGANLIVGTDAGIAPIKPADALRYALPQLQQLGMSAAEALHACTARAATALGLGHRKGQLRAGFDAYILAVDGDPLTSPEALHAIRAVFVRGTRIV